MSPNSILFPQKIKVAYMFPGVGSQQKGMGKAFYEQCNAFKGVVDQATDFLNEDVMEICCGEQYQKLEKLEYAQLILHTINVATYESFRLNSQIEPDFMLGYSLGEYSALVGAGVIPFTESLHLLKRRSQIVSKVEKEVGTMAWIVNSDYRLVEKACAHVGSENVTISAIDSPLKTCISGTLQAIREVHDYLMVYSGIVIPIKMSGPFHSPFMTEAKQEFREVLKGVRFNRPNVDVISNVSGHPHCFESLQDNLAEHLICPVLWKASIDFLDQQGVNLLFELGPKNILKFLAEENQIGATSCSIGSPQDVERTLGGLTYKNLEFVEVVENIYRSLVTVKNHNENSVLYQQIIHECCDQIEQQLQAAKQHNEFSEVEFRKAVAIFFQAMEAKQVPQSHFSQICKNVLKNKIYLDANEPNKNP